MFEPFQVCEKSYDRTNFWVISGGPTLEDWIQYTLMGQIHGTRPQIEIDSNFQGSEVLWKVQPNER